jgi:uncharacterized membrane protein
MSLVTVHCPNCWIEYGIPAALDRMLLDQRTQKSVYCPNGHTWFYAGEHEVDVERRKRQQLEQANVRLQEEARDAILAKNAASAMLKRTRLDLKRHKTRAAAGVCPCCNRSFVNMQRHMATKHPDYNVVPLKATP